MKKFIVGVVFLVLMSFGAYMVLAQETSTDEADSIRDNVQKKVEEARNIPAAYIGAVTDIAEQTIQINKYVFGQSENNTGEIQQISINEDEADFIKITKTSTVVNFSDLAIGDFIIAMGYRNGNGVLVASRILITTPIEATSRKSVLGEPSEIEKSSLMLTSPGGKEWEVEFGSRWVGPELSDIEEGDRIIVSGPSDGNTLEARFLHIIKPEQADAE